MVTVAALSVTVVSVALWQEWLHIHCGSGGYTVGKVAFTVETGASTVGAGFCCGGKMRCIHTLAVSQLLMCFGQVPRGFGGPLSFGREHIWSVTQGRDPEDCDCGTLRGKENSPAREMA